MGFKFSPQKTLEAILKSIVKSICMSNGLDIATSESLASVSGALLGGVTFEKRKLPPTSALHKLVCSSVRASFKEGKIDIKPRICTTIAEEIFSFDNICLYLTSEDVIEEITSRLKNLVSAPENILSNAASRIMELINDGIKSDQGLIAIDSNIKINEIIDMLKNSDKMKKGMMITANQNKLLEEFANNYELKIWSELSLSEMYIPNNYSFVSNDPLNTYDDVISLIAAFANGSFKEFIENKRCNFNNDIRALIIFGYQGIGKSSLLSKIAYDYCNKTYLAHRKIIYAEFYRMCHNEIFEMVDVCTYLGIDIETLKDSIIFFDALDESNLSESGCIVRINLLINILRRYNSRIIITCRHNFINTKEIPMSFEIMLHPFTEMQAIKWIENYGSKHLSLDVGRLTKAVSFLNQEVKQIILIPYILYTCASKNIDIANITELGKLYDVMFFGINAQSSITDYNKTSRYMAAEWSEYYEKITSIAIEICNAPDFLITQEQIEKILPSFPHRKLLTEFYLKRSGESSYKFIHNSIAEYFVARTIYSFIERALDNIDIKSAVVAIDTIMRDNLTLNYSIYEFLAYLLKIYNIHKKYSFDQLKDTFFTILRSSTIYDYSFAPSTSVLDKVHSRFVTLFNIFSECFKCISCTKSAFFHTMSTTEKDLFIKYTNLSNSMLNSIRYYDLYSLDLSHINLVGTKLAGLMLNRVNLNLSKLQKVNFVGAYLIDSSLICSDLRNSNMKNADLSGSLLMNADFRDAKLAGANFYCANLSYSDIRGATLSKTKFTGAIMYKCSITIEQMDYIDLDIIWDQHICVYDDNKLLLPHEIVERFKERRPVLYAFRYG